MLILIIIIGLAYLSGLLPRLIHYLNNLYISKVDQRLLDRFYTNGFAYYKLLDTKEKRKFLIRIIHIRRRNHLKISEEIKNSNTEVELLICAAFAQITFGYEDYEIERFSTVVVNSNTFYSKLVDHEVKGLTTGTGYIFYSWEDFLKGYKDGSDKVNLGLHELAHALYIDRFHGTGNAEWEQWQIKATLVLETVSGAEGPAFFRIYGKSNLNEFWAVTVECFFEDPITFKQQYASLYQATAIVLNQDMATRKMKQASTVLS